VPTILEVSRNKVRVGEPALEMIIININTGGEAALAAAGRAKEMFNQDFKFLQLINFWGKPTPLNFYEWLVGFTDGDGTFGISHNKLKNSYTYNFSISQSNYNIVTLHYIQKVLGVGSVTAYDKGKVMSRLQVQNRAALTDIIVPIFNNYPLFSFQHYRYTIFQNALLMHNKSSAEGSLNINTKLAIKELKELLNASNNPKDPNVLNYLSPHALVNVKPSIAWLIGFIEAEGSFNIMETSHNHYAHRFSITQLLDVHILVYIRHTFKINSAIYSNRGINTLDTTRIESIETIIELLKDNLVGVKALEFDIWANSFLNNRAKRNPQALLAAKLEIQKLRRAQLVTAGPGLPYWRRPSLPTRPALRRSLAA